ncbi:MAG: hypothetical protein HY805_10340 [Nitrospirae bacterium]|nr:hypothetical protein [Nitrospirota bacterium]
MTVAKQILLILGILIISLVDAGSSLAQSEFIVFSKQYDKPKGKPVTYIDTFKAYYGAYQLWVQSGQDGLNEVKNVSVSINGVEVLDSRDLRKSNPSIKPINLQSNNTIKVVLKGQGGNFIKVRIATLPLNITVLSPSAGETISSMKVIVTGTIENFVGELGVTVNGIVADVYGNQFVVSNVPLVEGVNTITVTVKDALRTATSSITVNAVIPSSYIELSSNIESGIAPLTAYFSASISNLTPSSYQMDFEGDGIVDWTGASFEDISHTYILEGIFYPTVVVIDSQGNSYWDVIAITVLSKAEMDALLKGKWEGMRSELAEGDV